MREILEEKNIRWLYHFTRVENLPNILRYGILPRTELNNGIINSHTNDEFRYDKCEDAICMSVSFPNYRMFYYLRDNNKGTKWVVLEIDASVLNDFSCAFCCTNAGNRKSYSIPLTERMGNEAFKEIFDEQPGCHTREELSISSNYPTDPQAEILVFGNIPVSYINAVFFNDYDVLREYSYLRPSTISFEKNDMFFYPRHDHIYWRK